MVPDILEGIAFKAGGRWGEKGGDSGRVE